MSLRMLFALLLTLYLIRCEPQSNLKIVSPDSKIVISFNLNESFSPYYSVKFQNKTILSESQLGLKLQSCEIFNDLKVTRVRHKSVDNTWTTVVGKSKCVRDYYNQTTISLQE